MMPLRRSINAESSSSSSRRRRKNGADRHLTDVRLNRLMRYLIDLRCVLVFLLGRSTRVAQIYFT